jgi:hypothetical protein
MYCHGSTEDTENKDDAAPSNSPKGGELLTQP